LVLARFALTKTKQHLQHFFDCNFVEFFMTAIFIAMSHQKLFNESSPP